MKKITRSFLAISLTSSMIFQNMLFVSNGEEIITKGTSKDAYVSSKSLDNQSSTIQPDPEATPHRNMGETPSTYSLQNQLPDLETKGLTEANSIGLGTVTTTTLNVRSGPSASYSVVGTLSNGTKVDIIGRDNNWYKISTNNVTGYVSAPYIKLSPLEKGIDVSKWNGTIDWNKVKADGIDYVIIRGGFGNDTVDPQFHSNMKGASDAGLKIGVYWFSYATSVAKAKEEAAKCLETIAPYKSKITYPVFYDFEYASVDYAKKLGITITKDLSSKMADAFLTAIKNAGYVNGIYTNKDFGDQYFYEDMLFANNLWIAQYSSACTYPRPYMMWQYTEKGTINGIGTSSKPAYFDMNYTYLKPISNQIPSNKIDLSSSSISEISSKTYTGSAIKPSIAVTLNNKTLKANEDYTVTYSNNTSIGTAKITINGIGNYNGSKTTTFKIIPKQVSNISLVKKTTSALTLSWSKLDDVSGYKIYKYNPTSDSYELLKTISNNSTTSYIDEVLKPASVYNYKIRGYKLIDGSYYYGNYSNVFSESTRINKVTNLKLDTRNATSLEISWDRVKDADGYKIYKLDTNTNTYKIIDTINSNSITSYKHSSIISATNYYYKVKAFKYLNGSNRYSDYSSTLKAATRPLQPSVTLSSTKSNYIKANWTKISKRTTGYQIYMSTSKNGTFSSIGTTENTSFTKGNLTKGKTYYFKVRAYRTVDGEKIYSLYSNVKSIVCK
ncbi:GH25 family lysozyme [Terrisporobacter mayombei]|uniref:Glycoside hydrolase n=1 Tax=Terrisporobacter mayombei TaxID=1541 RepID=A0ABY9Q112_9FIRM|nr:GH25 family lysozyme [Terrisporobacter mayombei]MCC3867327.1 SH3 domain-containing protein [Terrisporobacter mayombei]WMT81587.1 hypothetical protein TEMA_19290 [Terrisporobacter mayombei]